MDGGRDSLKMRGLERHGRTFQVLQARQERPRRQPGLAGRGRLFLREMDRKVHSKPKECLIQAGGTIPGSEAFITSKAKQNDGEHTKHLSQGPGGAFPKLLHCPHDASFCSMSTSELEELHFS